jgi:hypothetical protein
MEYSFMARKKKGQEPAVLATSISVRATSDTIKRIRLFAVGNDADLADVVYEAIYDKWSNVIDGLPEPKVRVEIDK